MLCRYCSKALFTFKTGCEQYKKSDSAFKIMKLQNASPEEHYNAKKRPKIIGLRRKVIMFIMFTFLEESLPGETTNQSKLVIHLASY